MLQMLIAAPNSGSGKTTVTIALLSALKARGLNPCAFKSGPDYIDPMFHRSVLGVESHNMDLFFSNAETVQNIYKRSVVDHGAAICEGAMGYYDGLGGTSDIASAIFCSFVVSSSDKISPILYIAIRFCVQKSGKFSSKRFAPMMSAASCKASAPCIVTLSNVPLPMPIKVIFIAILYTFQGYFQQSLRSPSDGEVQ